MDNSNIPGSPALGCGHAGQTKQLQSDISLSPTQGSGNAAGNWQPGLPLTIEGSGFGTLPVVNAALRDYGMGLYGVPDGHRYFVATSRAGAVPALT